MITYCKVCSKEIISNPARVRDGRGKFCSRKCHGEWMSKNLIGEKAFNWNGGQKKYICLFCGKEFTSDHSTASNKFCSYQCYWKWRSQNIVGNKCYQWKGGKQTSICKICGKEFLVDPCRLKRGNVVCCSYKCLGVWHGIHNSGENHYNFQGWKSREPYSPEWSEKFKQSIRKRDNFFCQLCGKIKDKKSLAVHHCDYDKQNNDSSNLISLCLRCHTQTNFNRQWWRDYFLEI